MNDSKRPDEEATDAVRRPWHTPVIDVVPLKSAQAGLGSVTDANTLPGTEAC